MLAGDLIDPYTGVLVTYRRGNPAHGVDIDHVFPEALAWDMGAARWPLALRERFANDPNNLLAVSASANRSKGDLGPAQWLPHITKTSEQCRFASIIAYDVRTYKLSLTRADVSALATVQQRCPA
ncbi:MAG: HNH endonuclease family protein [Actinomycetota bacterium]|nr:HNH endonuclease family protein [Actinomycetota bacterium]